MVPEEPVLQELQDAPEVRPVPRHAAWPLLGRVLVLPRSSFVRLAEEELAVWPLALGLVALTAIAKGAVAASLAVRTGQLVTRANAVFAVRYGTALLGPLLFAVALAGVLAFAQRFWDGDARFSRWLSAVSLALVPIALRNLIQAGYMAVTRVPLLHPGLSALLARVPRSVLGRVAYGLLAQVDAFALWSFVLLVLAAGIAGGRGGWRAVGVVALFLVVALAVGLLPSIAVAVLTAG